VLDAADILIDRQTFLDTEGVVGAAGSTDRVTAPKYQEESHERIIVVGFAERRAPHADSHMFQGGMPVERMPGSSNSYRAAIRPATSLAGTGTAPQTAQWITGSDSPNSAGGKFPIAQPVPDLRLLAAGAKQTLNSSRLAVLPSRPFWSSHRESANG